ncbi:putative RNA uridine N3 methyltransferase [Halanaeroarchaeum sp. HSR-CO]|uniref:putative RNA uridine N3 methyltransferase n=1 Tax=Halanaeroarchaeum sp. HSR-CO TaxID=2866382 RepID=UPI00217D39BF|nr:putative RNA uridine N3 methyltransferase [Halanaeroarchaeum sp. HSR-CO]
MTRSVLVPSSLVREAEDKREATRKLGYVARAAAVFRADRLGIFDDSDGERRWGGGFVETVLRYAATPPYLRKEAFGTRDELEYAGILPPLRVSAWTGSESSGSGSLRQGIVTQVGSEGRVRVNCGLQHPISLHVPPSMAVEEGERVTIRVSSRRPVRAKLVDEPLPGFVVTRTNLRDALDRPDAGFRVATSRHGTPVTVSSLAGLVERVAADGLTVAFGAPGRGLPDILDVDVRDIGAATGSATAGEGDPTTDAPAGFDAWLNTIPDQGSETVRTEVAMFASLGCLTLTE